MRILVHGFIESRRLTARAIEVLAESDAELVGWVARPRFTWVFDDRGPPCPRFEEPFPEGWKVPLVRAPLDSVVNRIDDENLRYLLDREQHFGDEYEVTRLRSEIVRRAQEILDATRPDAIVFSDVPHSALSYALYACGGDRGMQTLYFRYGPTPHIFAFAEGIGPALVDFVRAGTDGEHRSASPQSVEFVERLAGSYRNAAPPYMRAQSARWALASKAVTKARRAPRELISRRGAAKVAAVARRRNLQRWYEGSAVTLDHVSRDSVALFLHLQPERSTTPEGGYFAEQWLIAHSIARSLPSGWSLAIREHPSTFQPNPRLIRSADYYRALLRIPGVQLVSMTTDPYDLIDRARCVATVTGSVGLEAAARGRPALTFGDSVYRGCPGVFHVDSATDVAAILTRVASGVTIDREGILEFLGSFEGSSRSFVTHDHGDDVSIAINNGTADAEVLRRMLAHAVSR